MIEMRATRNARGLSLEDLSEKTGIASSQLSRYETGKHSPSVARALLVAEALGVSLDFLVTGSTAEPRR